MKFFPLKHIYFVLIFLTFTTSVVLAGVTSIRVGNTAPQFIDLDGKKTEPSDGGYGKINPLHFDESITFKAVATDDNGDDYYLIICKSDVVTANKSAKPVCKDGGWGISAVTKSGVEASIIYKADKDAKLKNDWYAFVCDHTDSTPKCSKSSQGSDNNGSPFYVHKQVGVLRFDDENCPELKELEELKNPVVGSGKTSQPVKSQLAELDKKLTNKEAEKIVKEEIDKSDSKDKVEKSELQIIDEEMKILKKEKKVKGTVDVKQIEVVADQLIEKREKLNKLAKADAHFCVTTSTDDTVQNVLDKKGKTVQQKTEYDIKNEGLNLTFNEDDKRSISMNFRQKAAKIDKKEEISGPDIKFKNKKDKGNLVGEKDAQKEQVKDKKEEKDSYKTITLKHETIDDSKESGLISKIIAKDEEVEKSSKKVSFEMNTVESIVNGNTTEENVVYQSSDNRKTDIYKYKNGKDSIISHEIKNYTIFHYGDGKESELYTFDDTVLHMRKDGVIEGFYVENIDIGKEKDAKKVSKTLLDRASRTLTKDYIIDLYKNGRKNPDFIIPKPFAMDKNSNVIGDLKYEITGEYYDKLKITFSATIDAYPIALDPSLQFTAPGAVPQLSNNITGETTSNLFGSAIVSADFDGDGDDDLAVGATDYNSEQGRVYIFYNDGEYSSAADSADNIITGEAGSSFGWTLSAGDMDGDSDIDLIVGGYQYSTGQGKVYIFYNDGTYPTAATSADVSILGEDVTSYNFSMKLATGDLDSDGDIDLAVGAPNYSTDTGRVYLFYQDGSWPADAGSADITIDGEASSTFGGGAVVAGDFNANGKTDLAVGAATYNSSQGRAYIFNNDGTWPTDAASADNIITGEATSNTFGVSMTADDLNGDSKTDLVVGADTYNGGQGRVYVFENDGTYPAGAASADVIFTGQAGDAFGVAVAASDLNADNKIDLAVGSSNYNSSGKINIFYGNADGTFGDSSCDTACTDLDDANITIAGEGGSALGQNIFISDLNFDGTNDLVVGDKGLSTNTGRVYIFYGEGGIENNRNLVGQANNDYFTHTVVAADVTGNGKDDLIIGAYGVDGGSTEDGIVYIFHNDGNYTNADSADDTIAGAASGDGKFGYALSVNDMNGDGLNDIIIGAPGMTASAGIVYICTNPGVGVAFGDAGTCSTLLGSAGGDEFGSVIATGRLNEDGDLDIVVSSLGTANGTVKVYYGPGYGAIETITGVGAGDNFGYSLALGDIDTDNDKNVPDTDLLVGAPDTANGTVYIFYNNNTAFPASASSANDTIDGAGAGDQFGYSIAVGDIDADMDDDIIVGAPDATNGTVYIFNNPDYTTPEATSYPDAGSADDTIAGATAGDDFGATLAVGDIDDDGDTDLIVGAPEVGTSKGTVYVFYNDGSVLPDAGSADIIIDGETDNSTFGSSLVVADLDANGVNDLFVGASAYNTNTGRGYIFYGDSEYSWNTKYPWRTNTDGGYRGGSNRHRIEGWADSGTLGDAMVTGDFNGDGHLDLAVSAEGYNSSQGQVYIFLNDGSLPMNIYDADVTITGDTSSQFGLALAANKVSETRDDMDDLVIGAPGLNSNDGAVYIFDGRGDWSGISSYTDADVTIAGTVSGTSLFGYSLVANADFGTTPDIHNDIVVGAPDAGKIYIYNNDGTYPTTELTADTTIAGELPGDRFGEALATGEMNTTPDKYVDLIVSAPSYNFNQGRVYIFYNDGFPGDSSGADVTFTGENTSDQFGFKIATGELSATRDDRLDLVVSAPQYASGAETGRVYVYYNDGVYGAADWTTDGGSAADRLGESLAVGDLSRDGRTDLIVGMSGYDSGDSNGIVRVYYNTDSGLTLSDSLINNTGTDSYAGVTTMVADLTGDGWNDLITGANGAYTNKGLILIDDYSRKEITGSAGVQYGQSMAIGDFDGDGDNDFAISAPEYNSSQGQVYIFFEDINNSTKAVNPGSTVTITGESTGDEFGYSLASGKVSETADTIDDLVIGAPGAASDVGWVYIFDGRTGWVDTYDATTDYDNRLKDNGSNQRCGTKVIAGYDLVGDSREDFAFACTGVLGSGSGEHYIDICNNDGTYPVDTFCANSLDISNTNKGVSMDVGDIDNDGWMDLVVGDPYVTTNDGAVYVYYGLDNPSGINSSVGLTITGEADSKFGTSVAVGDFNNNGNDDIAVGAPEYSTNQGRVYMFNNDGSIPTAAGSADETITGAAALYFGQVVAPVDYNVDGKTDIVVGAESHLYAFFNDSSYASAYTSYDVDLNDAKTSYATFSRQFAIGDLNYDGRDDVLISAPGHSSDTGNVLFYQNAQVECEPPNLTSVIITDTGGFTNDTTPEFSLAYSYDTGSGPATTYAQFSCDGGENWSSETAIVGASSPVTTSGFDITTGTTGCTTTNESKTITARLRNTCGYYIGNSASDSTYFDNTGPSITEFNAVFIDVDGISVTATTTTDGTGSGDPYDYMVTGVDCTGSQPESAWSDDPVAMPGLSANTQYAFKIKARDELDNEGSYTSCGATAYTLANTPAAPTVDNAAATTLDVDPATGGAEEEMAIYVASAEVDCDGSGGLGYVQSVDGSIGVSEDWVTDAVWDTTTITGLTASTTYYICAKARNGDDTETVFGTATSEATISDVAAPAFDTGYPTDNGSSTSTPVNAGTDITFDARVTGGDDFWLLVCKNGSAPTTGSPPECNGGSGNRWAISSQTTSAEMATATYTTLVGDSESNAWFAFVCNASTCSAANQASGDDGSPFLVNHAPTFATVLIGDTSGGTGTIEPGDTIYFNLPIAQIADADTDATQDTVSMFVCASAGFTYGGSPGCTGVEICSAADKDPTSQNAECNDSAGQAPIPTTHGTKNAYIYVLDNHGMASSSGTNAQTYSVVDTAPTLISYTAIDAPAPTAGGSDTVDFIAYINDDNGDTDVTAVEGYFFDDAEIDLSGGTCSEDENNCYLDSSCTLTASYGTSTQLQVDCQVTVWFNANASSDWEVHVNPTDDIGKETGLANSNVNLVNDALSAIDVAESGINYGSLGVGTTSAQQTITIQNMGNQVIDASIAGTNMTSGVNNISFSQQKWSDVTGFNYASAGYALVDTAASTSTATGCFNADLPVRNANGDGSGSDDIIYVRLQTPSSLSSGTYTGTNTISFITCD